MAAASDRLGFDLFNTFSADSERVRRGGATAAGWDAVSRSPANRTVLASCTGFAGANGLACRSSMSPGRTLPADDIFTTAGMARGKTQQVIRNFSTITSPARGSLRNVFVDYGFFSKKIMASLRSRRPRGAYSHRHRQNPDRLSKSSPNGSAQSRSTGRLSTRYRGTSWVKKSKDSLPNTASAPKYSAAAVPTIQKSQNRRCARTGR